VLLATGILAIHLGALLFVLAERNAAEGAQRRLLDLLFLSVGGMVLVAVTTLIMESTGRMWMHEVSFYRAVVLAVPPVLAAIGMGAERRLVATVVAGVYTVFLCALIWLLPLFPAEPKLGPVLYPVTHFVPPEFPLLLIVPALAIDLLLPLRPRLVAGGPWRRAIAMAVAFMGTFLPAQWAFANFLMSPPSRNWFFGTIYFDYRTPADGFYRRFMFFPHDRGASSLIVAFQLLEVTVVAVLTMRVGLAFGEWMRRVRR
jgi:hypothetical protein